jgi:hypothetical protein
MPCAHYVARWSAASRMDRRDTGATAKASQPRTGVALCAVAAPRPALTSPTSPRRTPRRDRTINDDEAGRPTGFSPVTFRPLRPSSAIHRRASATPPCLARGPPLPRYVGTLRLAGGTRLRSSWRPHSALMRAKPAARCRARSVMDGTAHSAETAVGALLMQPMFLPALSIAGRLRDVGWRKAEDRASAHKLNGSGVAAFTRI